MTDTPTPAPVDLTPEEEAARAPMTGADYWGQTRHGDMPSSMVPTNLRELALMVGERLTGMQHTLPGHIMSREQTDPIRAHLNGYQEALQDILMWLTDDDGELRKEVRS